MEPRQKNTQWHLLKMNLSMEKTFLLSLTLCFFFVGFAQQTQSNTKDQVLVFTKTSGFRHQSIETGVTLLEKLALQNDFKVTHTEDSLDFNSENLKNYKMVLFLSTTNDVLGPSGQKALQDFMHNGGSFMGIHAATDTEFNWPWYGRMIGAYFMGHPNNPNVRKAEMQVIDSDHASTKMLPTTTWQRIDEWYNFRNISDDIQVLLNLDESTYEGGTNGTHHPIAWYHEFEGARVFYTGGGHTKESFSEPLFVAHLLGGINYCLKRD